MKAKLAILALIIALAGVPAALADKPAAADQPELLEALQKFLAATESASPAETYYIDIVSKVNNTTGKEQVTIDLGRMLPARLGIREADARNFTQSATFTNVADALNYMAKRGWTLASTYSTTGRTATISHFIMSMTSADPKTVASSITSPQ